MGMLGSKEGIRVNPEKAQVVRDWLKPTSITELRSFIGLMRFFRHFINDLSSVAVPLTNLTKKGVRLGKWGAEFDEALKHLKEVLTTAPILIAPTWKNNFRCHVDASQHAVGGTLTQLDEKGSDRVVDYF